MASLLEKLSIETGIGPLDLRRIMLTAPVRYRTFPIAKRTGGERIIAQPAREVKSVQRALVKVLLNFLPVHDYATAYRRGLSVRDNALPHAIYNGAILKLDLKDFFPSIRARDWESYCNRTACLTEVEEVFLTSRLLFRRDPKYGGGLRLAIGAPSSPALSNILMCEFDARVTRAVMKEKVVYTRYADDLTFSAPRTGFLTHVKSLVCKVIRELKSPVLELNDLKTTLVTKKFRRSVTGVTLTNNGEISIGRDRKRLISAMVHRAKAGRLSDADRQSLAGILAYVNSVEPDFLDALRKKYGNETIVRAQHDVFLGRKLPEHPPPMAPK